MRLRFSTRATLAVLVLSASIVSVLDAPVSHAQAPMVHNQTLFQPIHKEQVYVFLADFLDVKNSTSPSQILHKLSQLNSFYNNNTYGTWQFNWALIYPSLGQPWNVANETYGEAQSNLTPVWQVIPQAWSQLGPFPNMARNINGWNMFNTTNVFLIIHAGNDSSITGRATDIWSITSGPGYLSNGEYSYDVSFVAENDPVGAWVYEINHQLEWYTETGKIVGCDDRVYGLRCIGEGFPDPKSGVFLLGMTSTSSIDLVFGGGGTPDGDHPSDYGAFDRITLGFPINFTEISPRQSITMDLYGIEEHVTGNQAILIPVRTVISGGTCPACNTNNYFYILELRKAVDGDGYQQWNTGLFPNKIGLLIWYFNMSENGNGVYGYLVKAHSFDLNARSAMFGPCAQSCTNMTMSDLVNNVNVNILSTSNSSFRVKVDNVGSQPSISVCPSFSFLCFLGFLNLEAWGLFLNVTLATASVVVPIFVMKRTRRQVPPLQGGLEEGVSDP